MIGAVITRILLGLYEEIRALIEAGSTPEAITAALQLTIKAASYTARERIHARAGETIAQSRVLAIWCEDLAASMAAAGHTAYAIQLRAFALELNSP